MRKQYGLVAALLVGAMIADIDLSPARAATTYATTAFQQQWQQGETVAPNFWGPLANATDGLMEPYAESPGGQRLVQYFDKGRMELTQPASGIVTNGLLTTELLTGRVQLGDNTFVQHDPATIAIAGDPDSPSPTYAGLATKGQQLLATTADSSRRGAATYSVTATGEVLVNPKPDNQPPTYTFTTYDTPTQHNVAKAFDEYRARVGLGTIGYAISEPFVAVVKVAGTQRTVLVQLFERRVLTYTADNPPAFQVEMGNIGQHYDGWRYRSPPPATTVATQTAPATAIPPPAAPSTNGGTAPIRPGIPPASAGSCAILYPVKGTTENGQKVYDVPGSTTYAGTKPDICFVSPADAEADGFRPLKH